MGLRLWGPEAARQVTKGPWRDVVRWDTAARADGIRRRVFCGSLCDVFESHPTADATRPRVWETIRACSGLDWLLLTKRPERIADHLPPDWRGGWPHVWLGTTVEDMRVAPRVDVLRSVPAAVRFVSYEPALGPLDDLDLRGIDWLIYGGESGPGRRPDRRVWARSMRDRCRSCGVAYWHKQESGPRMGQGEALDGEIIHELPRGRMGCAGCGPRA
jgi:protein gp37